MGFPGYDKWKTTNPADAQPQECELCEACGQAKRTTMYWQGRPYQMAVCDECMGGNDEERWYYEIGKKR